MWATSHARSTAYRTVGVSSRFLMYLVTDDLCINDKVIIRIIVVCYCNTDIVPGDDSF